MSIMESTLTRLYFDRKSPAFMAGKPMLYRVAKKYGIGRKSVDKFLLKQPVYTLHRPLRHKFPRNKIVATGIDSHWQADLCDMRRLKHKNSQYQYILTVVDVLSKSSFARPIKRKTPEEVLRAFKSILEESGRKPESLMTDQGNEFKGVFKKFLDQQGIHFYFAPNLVLKAANVERFNRTLKNRIWRYFTRHDTERWIGILPDIMHDINHSISRPIKMRPVDVDQENWYQVWERLYGDINTVKKSFQFVVGDKVRVARWRKVFEKGYTPTFTKALYTVVECIPRRYPVYRLTDSKGELVKGVFYAEQLQKVLE